MKGAEGSGGFLSCGWVHRLREGEKQIPRVSLRLRSGVSAGRALPEDDKEACRTREYCLAKNARHRAARLGPSLAQKRRSFRMTRDKGLWRARVKVMPFPIASCAVEPFPSRDCPPSSPQGAAELRSAWADETSAPTRTSHG